MPNYYYINYDKGITAIGEINPPYMVDRGYTLVDKETYDNWVKEHPIEIEDEEEE